MEPATGRGRAVWWALLGLVLLRALATFHASMWAWGLNVQRFLAPAAAWLPWLACALLLVRPVGEAAAPRLDGLGTRLARSRAWGGLAAAALALLVWALPDRAWLTGDFMLRQGVSETREVPAPFMQALPLEVFLDGTLPRWFGAAGPLEPNTGARLVGALAAFALALAAVGLARAWKLGGGASLAAAAAVCGSGCLVCFTGLAKPPAVLCALTAIAALGAIRLVSAGAGGVALGLATAIALFTHRGALALLPMWATALVLTARARAPKRAGFWLALALPLAALALTLPEVARIALTIDVPRHLLPGGPGGRGALAAALAPLHLADLGNLALFYTPALVPAALLFAPHGPAATASPARWLPRVLALSFLPALLFLHPTQGIPRDLDDFAPAGMALAILCAQVLGGALADGRLAGWLAPALVAAVALPSLQWLVHMHDPERGLARARALAIEAPARPDVERARLWDALAYRAFREQRWDRALEASAQSVRFAPHPRAVAMLAIARTYTGDHRGAESLYVSLTERTPDDPLAWLGLGGAALRVGDSLRAAQALARLDAYAPGSREARLIRRHLRMFPRVWPTVAEAPGGKPGPGGR